MKNYLFLIILLSSALPLSAQKAAVSPYKNAQEAQIALTDAIAELEPKIPGQSQKAKNFLTHGLAKEGVQKWNAAVDNISLFVKNLLDEKRTIAISAKNRALFEKARRVVNDGSNDFINTIKISHGTDPKAAKESVAKLEPRIAEFSNLYNELEPVTNKNVFENDFAKSVEAKKMLRFLLQKLKVLYQKLGGDARNF